LGKVAVVTDSIACLTRELVEEYGIEIIPLNFYANGQVYKDGVDVTPSQAYDLFLKDPRSFKTAAASPEDCFNAYLRASSQASNIICVTLSSKLSALHDVVCLTAKQFQTELPGTSVMVLDSGTATAAEGFITLVAARAAKEGKSVDEVTRIAEQMKEKVNLVAYMDTVRYVYRSGRIPRVAAIAGSILNIRPIFTFSSGVPNFMGAVRSEERGVERLLEVMKEKVGKRSVHVAVMHVYACNKAEKLMDRVASEFNCAELWLTEFSSLMGYACGTGTLGLAFYPDD